MLSPVRLSVCLSVPLVHSTPAVEIWYLDIHEKIYADRLRGTPPPGELNTTGVAKYSDFGPIEGYISQTVQDMRYVSINH